MAQVEANGIQLEVETRGPEDAPAFVLIRGLSTQLIQWPEPFLERFVEAGFRVVLLDNRDCGLSSKMDAADAPSLSEVASGEAPPPYTIADMAQDVVGVLDALGIDRADAAGMSLGGMIAQHLAFDHADRFRSVTSVMSSSGARGLPSGTPEAMRALSEPPPDPNDREGVIAHNMRSQKVIASPDFPPSEAELRAYFERAYDRCYCPAGTARQMMAVISDTTRAERLSEIELPFQVLHGSADPLIPLACGEDTAERAGAPLVVIEGMGHDVTVANGGRVADALIDFARR